MVKNELRRLAIARLVESLNGPNGRGGIAKLAVEIGKAPDYISRVLYEDGKPGKKNIGIELVDVLDDKFPGWLEGKTQSAVVIDLPKVQPEFIKEVIAMMEQMDAEHRGMAKLRVRDIYEEYVSRKSRSN